MFGKVIKFHGSALIEAELIASSLPGTMPLTSDGIDNLGSGYTLAPGSTMYVTGIDKRYILGTDSTWSEMPGSGGGSTVTVTQIKSSGEKIATITVDGVGTDLYASAGGSGGGAVDSVNGKTGDVVLAASDVGAVADADYVHTDNNYTTAEKTKLSGIAAGAEVNVQPDWSQTDTDAEDYIKNKPTIPTVTGKADKVASATSGNFAGLDSNGNLTDSGKKASDFQTALTFDSTPTENSANPVTSDGVYTALAGKAETTNTTVSLPAASWVGAAAPYTQTVNVTGILATDTPIIDVVVSSTVATGIDEVAAWACITKAKTGAGTITFSCYEDKPTTDITVAVKVVR